MRVLHIGHGFRPFTAGGLVSYAEDVMDAQIARGDAVAYFFSGRRYPWLRRPRLKRWRRRSVTMFELMNSSMVFGGERGTRFPLADLDFPEIEDFFLEALDAHDPEVVHVQELMGLPSSLIRLARRRGVGVVMTLQDYAPLCPTIKLYDVDGRICLRDDVGEQCARCSWEAPDTPQEVADVSFGYLLKRARATVPGFGQLADLNQQRLRRRLLAEPPPAPGSARQVGLSTVSADPAQYQRRRNENVKRLSEVDILVAQSRRVAEIYQGLGVDPARLRTLHLTLAHIARIRPRHMPGIPKRLHFATLNGATSVAKGAEVLTEALDSLAAMGLRGRFKLSVVGWVADHVLPKLAHDPDVEIVGSYDPQELQAILESVDVGIVPSIWEEAYGYVGVELLAKGIPVIGNAGGGIVDYVREGETGWLNRDRTGAELARIMAGLIDRPAEVLQMHRQVLTARDELIKPVDRHVEELDAIYHQAIAEHETPRSNSARTADTHP